MTNSNSCTASFVQMAGIEALRGPQEDVNEMIEEFRRRRDFLVDGLNALDGVTCVRPKGAFYVFPNVKSLGLPSSKLQARLLEEAGVAALSGTAFGPEGEGYIRFSYANSKENIERALGRIADAVEHLLDQRSVGRGRFSGFGIRPDIITWRRYARSQISLKRHRWESRAMVASAQTERPYTAGDLVTLPEDGKRYEMIGGELVVHPRQPSRISGHKRAVSSAGYERMSRTTVSASPIRLHSTFTSASTTSSNPTSSSCSEKTGTFCSIRVSSDRRTSLSRSSHRPARESTASARRRRTRPLASPSIGLLIPTTSRTSPKH